MGCTLGRSASQDWLRYESNTAAKRKDLDDGGGIDCREKVIGGCVGVDIFCTRRVGRGKKLRIIELRSNEF